MTTPEHTQAPETAADTVDASTTKDAKAAVPAFAFPFKPTDFAQSKDKQPWYQKSNKSNHDSRPGAAPSGTRRSMGKR
jgi:hypothetical protein